jgi:hypothetical protein
MEIVAGRSGVTFAVDEVTPAGEMLPEWPVHRAMRAMLGREIESCGDYHSNVVKDANYQGLLAAVYMAFSQHRPLVLTPDAVWVTIAQGIAHHMAIHGERLRERLVSHAERLELRCEVAGWVEGSPENPWPEAFASWSGQIREHVGAEVHDLLVCDFSTTGPVERTVSQIVMMDVFERYFAYVLVCVCGIPTVTLEGTTADWERLREKVRGLKVFDIDWWLEHLLPICDQFVAASRGEVDLEHWRGICKLRQEYGGDVINGWVCKLFPYIREWYDGPCRLRNPIFETGKGMQTLFAPPGLSRVPFVWRNAETGQERKMEVIAGLVGVTQDAGTMALRAKLGWAVREEDKMKELLGRLKAEHGTGMHPRADESAITSEDRFFLPAELGELYDLTDGVELFGRGGVAVYRIVSLAESLPELTGRGDWARVARLADGSWLAVNLMAKNPSGQDDRELLPVCHVPKRGMGARLLRRPEMTGNERVVALSFTELLERMLDSEGAWFWEAEGFVGYGKAREYEHHGVRKGS